VLDIVQTVSTPFGNIKVLHGPDSTLAFPLPDVASALGVRVNNRTLLTKHLQSDEHFKAGTTQHRRLVVCVTSDALVKILRARLRHRSVAKQDIAIQVARSLESLYSIQLAEDLRQQCKDSFFYLYLTFALCEMIN